MMRTLAFVVAAVAVAVPSQAQTSTVRLAPRQEVVLEETAATAAWAVDPDVVETNIQQGRVTVVGRSAGTTIVSVVGAGGVQSYEIVVTPPHPRTTAGGGAQAGRGSTTFQGGYDSSTTRATANLDMIEQSGERVRRFHLAGVARGDREGSAEAVVSLPYLSFELSSPGHEMVLFDQVVEHSPLTVDNVSVRGAHLRRGPLLVHVGVASSLLYDNLILPGRAEAVAGVGYGLSRGRYTLTPSVFVFPSAKLGGERGAVGSLALSRGRESDPFRLRTELGYGGRWGGAAELAFDSRRNHLRFHLRHQPRGFASLGLGAPRGTFAEGLLTSTAGRVSLNASASLSRYALQLGGAHRSDAASGTARFALAKDLFLTGGASLGWFDTEAGAVRALSLPAGLAYEGRRAGASLLYRYQENTATNHGGSGGRLSVWTGGSRLRGRAFVDAQREAPTVDFALREEPRLQRLLAEQGLTAQTPEDVARLVSLYAPLERQGYLQGVSVNVHPWRVQGGGDLTLLLQKDGRQQVRFHILLDRTRTVVRRRATTLAGASYARQLAGAEIVAGYTWSSSDIDGWVNQGSSFQVTLRKRFDGVPRLPWMGGGAITGQVFADEEAKGATKGMPPQAGTQVRLDGSRLAVSDERGRFRFDNVSPGPHTVEAILPSAEDTFFTTPSSAVVQPGASVGFGLSRTPARLVGFVRDDAGRPIPAVVLRVEGESRKAAATTDSGGRFALATAAGDYIAAIDAESLPEGYDASSVRPAGVHLRRGEAARLELVVTAHRALTGRVHGNGAGSAEVRLVELGRTVAASADGSYAFRNLKPGKYTVAATAGVRTVVREVLVPEGSALLRDVDLDLSNASDPRAASGSGID